MWSGGYGFGGWGAEGIYFTLDHVSLSVLMSR